MSDVISKDFKMTCYKIEYNKHQEKAKTTSTFTFTMLYTTIPHKLLFKILHEVVNFVFKSKTRSQLDFSKT